MKRCTLYTCFIRGIIRRLILRAIVRKKENHGSIVVGQSRKITSSFLTRSYTTPNPAHNIPLQKPKALYHIINYHVTIGPDSRWDDLKSDKLQPGTLQSEKFCIKFTASCAGMERLVTC